MNTQEVIYRLRTNMGLSQDELAEKLGISRSAVGMYEQGKREPDFEILDMIADIFDVSIGYLAGNDERGHYPRHEITRLTAYAKRMPRNMGVTLEEERLIKAYRSAGDDVKRAVKAVLRIKA